jgi:predicted RNase H-like HicB family nuclease
MTLKTDIADTLQQGASSGFLSFTVVFREVHEESEMYFVGECLEMPGCVSQGTTQEEAKTNLEEAMKLCLSVMFEDCLKQMISRQRV